MLAQSMYDGVREALLIFVQLLIAVWPLAVAVVLAVCIGYLRNQRNRDRV